ncbi:MAG TPA: nucleotide exchange factor GrpE, partial [Motiliproteus sp.]
EQAQAALRDAEDQVLRARADVQNIRRRAEQDVEKAHKFGLEKFANELLPVVDNLERGLESASQEQAGVEAIREGVELTLGMFKSALAKFNVETVDPVGAPFDPQHHQAMSMVESADAEPNSVLHVMQKGYLLNGRLLRPAMVVVSKAPAAQSVSIDEKA